MYSETAVTVWAWINTLLLTGCALSAVGGLYSLARSRGLSVFQLRRRARLRGWKLLMMSVLLLAAFGLMLAFGRPGLAFLFGLRPA